MKTVGLPFFLLLSSVAVFGQDKSEIIDKAPPEIEEALRARVNKFYELFSAGKFKEAYSYVAEDSQDKYFQSSKDQYKGCEIIKIRYTEDFTKATVVTACKTDWRFQNTTTPMSFPLVSNWVKTNGEWYWHYVKPTIVPSPFSPTGFVPVPADSADDNVSPVPKDIAGAGQAIMAKVGIDKAAVQLQPLGTSFDTVHVRNDMPGDVSIKIEMPHVPGLKVTLEKDVLHAHESASIVFEWRSDAPGIECLDCLRKMPTLTTARLIVDPLSRVFPITVSLQSPQNTAPQDKPPVRSSIAHH
jgi:hypothetical protein